jgi:hypothetical protein
MLNDLVCHLLDGMGVLAVKQDHIEADRKGQRGQHAKHFAIVILCN